MGIYVNPGTNSLEINMGGKIYVDKSLIFTVLNEKFRTEDRFMCVSRPRRFGKTMVGNLVSAYYTRGADSRPIFEKLQIAGEPGWDKWLNKCNVIKIDLGSFFSRYHGTGNVIAMLNQLVVSEMREEFPNVPLREGALVAEAISDVFKRTSVPFVVIIDEYDVMVREQVSEKEFQSYLELLNSLFKGAECGEAIGLAYITGILPIVRDRVQSKLNNFKEYTMLSPRDLAPYIGFTLDEVKALCEKHKIDYDECLRWYDGYHIDPEVSICNSNSVCEAITTGVFDDYWSKTGAYTAINDFIETNYDGIREDIAKMVGGGSVVIDAGNFMNRLDAIKSKDDVFTYLIHLGYLVYNQKDESCSIPNGEIRKEWRRALRRAVNYQPICDMIQNSEDLLKATLACDETAVAKALDKAHKYVTSAKNYRNEGALQSAVGLAYFSATSKYTIHKELPAGDGFADIGFVPYVAGAPGIIIELKMDKSPDAALDQIKERDYASVFSGYRGPIYLVGVSYGKRTEKHKCKIEVIEKQD